MAGPRSQVGECLNLSGCALTPMWVSACTHVGVPISELGKGHSHLGFENAGRFRPPLEMEAGVVEIWPTLAEPAFSQEAAEETEFLTGK